MNLNIFVSNNCFVYCKGCYSYSREERCNKLLSSEKIIDFLNYAYNHGIKKVTLCGGDPLTRPDIIALLQEIKNIGFYVSLDTMGIRLIKDTTINKKVLKKIDSNLLTDKIDIIGIPIDGTTNEIIKLFRPTQNDLLKDLISVCKTLKKANIKICINTVVHKGNLNNSRELAHLVEKIEGVVKWQIFQYEPIGKYGFLNRQLFEISNEEFNTFKTEVVEAFNNKKCKIEFKDSNSRIYKYLLIDNSGNAWVPSFSNNSRKTIGNIINKEDWESICLFLKNNKRLNNKRNGDIK